MIKIKRIYEQASKDDGYRILVDRLWPRGLSKQSAQVDQWLRDIAPSTQLRRWFNHEASRFDTFTHRYFAELEKNELTDDLLKLVRKYKKVALLYSANDTEHNQADCIKKVALSQTDLKSGMM